MSDHPFFCELLSVNVCSFFFTFIVCLPIVLFCKKNIEKMKKNLADIPSIEMFEGYVGKMIHTEKMSVLFWEIKAHSALPAHAHHNEQITIMQKGEMELTVDGVVHHLKAGDIVVIPPNVVHSAMPITDCTVLDLFCPVREDYRQRSV